MSEYEDIGEDADDEVGDKPGDQPIVRSSPLGNLPSVMGEGLLSAFASHSKYLCVGTNHGTLHILDIIGNEVRRFKLHKSPINHMAIDPTGELLLTCSDDGSVMMTNLYTIKCIKSHMKLYAPTFRGVPNAALSIANSHALELAFASLPPSAGPVGGTPRNTSSSPSSSSSSKDKDKDKPGLVGRLLGEEPPLKRGAPLCLAFPDPHPPFLLDGKKRVVWFVHGGHNHTLTVTEKGRLGYENNTVHRGEGAVTAAAWGGRFVAWANDNGVKVYDMERRCAVCFISKDAHKPFKGHIPSPRQDTEPLERDLTKGYLPQLCWLRDTAHLFKTECESKFKNAWGKSKAVNNPWWKSEVFFRVSDYLTKRNLPPPTLAIAIGRMVMVSEMMIKEMPLGKDGDSKNKENQNRGGGGKDRDFRFGDSPVGGDGYASASTSRASRASFSGIRDVDGGSGDGELSFSGFGGNSSPKPALKTNVTRKIAFRLVASFETDYVVCGVEWFDKDHLILLAYYGERSVKNPFRKVENENQVRLQVRIVTRNNQLVYGRYIKGVHRIIDYDHPTNFRLVRGGDDPPSFYVVGPQELFSIRISRPEKGAVLLDALAQRRMADTTKAQNLRAASGASTSVLSPHSLSSLSSAPSLVSPSAAFSPAAAQAKEKAKQEEKKERGYVKISRNLEDDYEVESDAGSVHRQQKKGDDDDDEGDENAGVEEEEGNFDENYNKDDYDDDDDDDHGRDDDDGEDEYHITARTIPQDVMNMKLSGTRKESGGRGEEDEEVFRPDSTQLKGAPSIAPTASDPKLNTAAIPKNMMDAGTLEEVLMLKEIEKMNARIAAEQKALEQKRKKK